jgi:hypothetical protein
MVLGQRNSPIEALPAQCSNEPFAQPIRLRAPHRRSNDLKVEVHERLIESGGEDCVAVVEDKSGGLVRRYSFAELLEGPGGGWMRGHVKVNNSARRVFHDHQYVNNRKVALATTQKSQAMMAAA